MGWIETIFLSCVVIAIYACVAHYISYMLIKQRTIKKKKWGLNICSGKTDGGGINADILRHSDSANFVLIDDIYHLPFQDKEFDTVLSSHTIEHVDDPQAFYKEMKRVAKEVTLIVPPLWDIAAACNFFEHKWLFVTLKKVHTGRMPMCVRLPFAQTIHRVFGQRLHA